MIAATYSRVSTPDQKLDSQLDELRDYISRRGWKTYDPQYPALPVDGAGPGFSDVGFSGAKTKRPGLDALLAAAARREFQVVVVSRFDRLGRSTLHLLQLLNQFRELNIDVVSVHQAIDTTTSMGRMLFTVIAAFAEVERDMIRERSIAGQAAARARGARIGRPQRDPSGKLRKKVVLMRARKPPASWTEICKVTGLKRTTAFELVHGRKGKTS